MDAAPPPSSATLAGLSALDGALNLHHIELVTHLVSNSDMFNLSFSVGDYFRRMTFVLRTGLDAPYLLHQLLAFSARHLASLHPRKSADYLHLASSLQMRAVSLFNATALARTGAAAAVDGSNCVAVLAFSSVLGHHLLADVLAPPQRDPETLDGFLARYVQAMDMNRGVVVVSTASWPLLMTTEVGPTIAASAAFARREPKGQHCRGLQELVDGAAGLSGAEREACRRAVRHLQVGFDAVEEAQEDQEGEEDSYRHQMIFVWTMMAPPELAALLTAKRPEVLVLLGYYALLLYHGRRMWQVGDAGRYILGLIMDSLGPEWHPWLKYPREKMGVLS